MAGWGLRPVELGDAPLFEQYLGSLDEPLTEHGFASLFTWREAAGLVWREVRGHLCVFSCVEGEVNLMLPPLGDGDAARAALEALELADEYNLLHRVKRRSRIEYLSEELLPRFATPGLVAEPMATDYVYCVRRMIDLDGPDLASKRQGKNRFLRRYAHRVERYDPAVHLAPCLQLLDHWQAQRDAREDSGAGDGVRAWKRAKEGLACRDTLRWARELGLRGMVVSVKCDGETAAQHPLPADLPRDSDGYALCGFTLGAGLGRDQSAILVEKTDLNVAGLAQFIFSEFCRSEWSDRPLVNAGDDWGLETLAWTKTSYRPVKLLRKYALRREPAAAIVLPSPAAMPAPVVIAPEPEPAEVLPSVPPMQGTAPLPVRVRAAERRDVAAALELEQACFSPEVRLGARQLRYLQQRRTAAFFVAEQGDEVVGEGIALVRRHKGDSSGRIYSLAVRPGHRGQDIGKNLLRAMLDALADRGARRVYLQVEQGNDPAIRLYGNHGFRPIGTLPGYYGQGRDGIHMMLDLSAVACPSTPPNNPDPTRSRAA